MEYRVTSNIEKAQLLLDARIAKEFHEHAKKSAEYPLDCGAMSDLKNELMELCGVTELEALNILCGRNVRDYINKYTGRAEGRVIEAKKYQGEEYVVYRIDEEEKGIFG